MILEIQTYDKQRFLEMLSAHITIVGGCISAERLDRMSLGEVFDTIYPNDLRLKVENINFNKQYQ